MPPPFLVLVLAATPAHAEPTEPIFIVESWHRADATGHVMWTPLLGDRVLDPQELLELTGERALAHANRFKRGAGIGLAIGGAFAVPLIILAAFNHHETVAWIGGGASAVMLGGSIYELMTIRHLTAGEAHALADRYNTIHVAPYLVPAGGGLTVHRAF